MTKFDIAEKYNQVGQASPREFFKWLAEHLPQAVKGLLGTVLNHILDKFKEFDRLYRAALLKIVPPWKKDKEEMVEPEYYDYTKTEDYARNLGAVFRILGMEDERYFDPEEIAKAKAVEEFVLSECAKTRPDGRGEDPEEELARWELMRDKAVESIDFDKRGGFQFSMGGQGYRLAVIPAGRLTEIENTPGAENIRENALLERNGYFVFDAENEHYKASIEAYRAGSVQGMGNAEKGTDIPMNETEPEQDPDPLAAPEKDAEAPVREDGPKKKGQREYVPDFDISISKAIRLSRDVQAKKPGADATKEERQAWQKDIVNTYAQGIVAGIAEKAGAEHTFARFRASGKMISGDLVRIPFLSEPSYVRFDERVFGKDIPRTEVTPRKDKATGEEVMDRTITVSADETFQVLDASGHPTGEEIGALDMLGCFQAVAYFTQPYKEAEKKPFDGILHSYTGKQPDVRIPEGTMLMKGGCFNEVPEVRTIDFNHQEVFVERGAIVGLSGLREVKNVENVTFADGAIVGCRMSQDQYLTPQMEAPEEEYTPEQYQEAEQILGEMRREEDERRQGRDEGRKEESPVKPLTQAAKMVLAEEMLRTGMTR